MSVFVIAHNSSGAVGEPVVMGLHEAVDELDPSDMPPGGTIRVVSAFGTVWIMQKDAAGVLNIEINHAFESYIHALTQRFPDATITFLID